MSLNIKKVLLLSYIFLFSIIVAGYFLPLFNTSNISPIFYKVGFGKTIITFFLITFCLCLFGKLHSIMNRSILSATLFSYVIFIVWADIISQIKILGIDSIKEPKYLINDFTTILPSFIFDKTPHSYSLLENLFLKFPENIFVLTCYTAVYGLIILFYLGPIKKFVVFFRQNTVLYNSKTTKKNKY